eukprot:9700046-Prorocentrum_lima.AAC.1
MSLIQASSESIDTKLILSTWWDCFRRVPTSWMVVLARSSKCGGTQIETGSNSAIANATEA